MEEKVFLISDVAKQVEVESHVLRYWEEELELPIQRNKMGHRCYTGEDINRLKQIKDMKEQGFQLKAIKTALEHDNPMCDKMVAADKNEDKTVRLQFLLKNIMMEVIREGNEELCDTIKQSILKEMDYQFRMQEEREDERETKRLEREEGYYRSLDEMLREKSGKKEKRKKHSFF